jgi:hypothetical protein
VDYGGHWKLLHYAAKRFFNPLLVSAEYSSITHVVDIYLTSDINQALAGLHFTSALPFCSLLLCELPECLPMCRARDGQTFYLRDQKLPLSSCTMA